jgi:hypothetical protein
LERPFGAAAGAVSAMAEASVAAAAAAAAPPGREAAEATSAEERLDAPRQPELSALDRKRVRAAFALFDREEKGLVMKE